MGLYEKFGIKSCGLFVCVDVLSSFCNASSIDFSNPSAVVLSKSPKLPETAAKDRVMK